jgi:asparagine synthase (glutamine-hydrolysing)
LKALLRPLVRRYLPPTILGRPKTGFGVPVAAWLRGSLREAFEEFVCRPDSNLTQWIDPSAAREFLAEHQRGADHGTRLWALLALGVWGAVVLERRWRADEPLPVAVQERVTA